MFLPAHVSSCLIVPEQNKSHIKSKNKLEQSQRLSWEAVVGGWYLSGCVVTAAVHGAAWKPPVCRGRACRGPAVWYVNRYVPTGACTCVCVLLLCQTRFEKMCQKQLMTATQESSQNSQGRLLPWQLLPPPHVFTVANQYEMSRQRQFVRNFLFAIIAYAQRGNTLMFWSIYHPRHYEAGRWNSKIRNAHGSYVRTKWHEATNKISTNLQ